MPDEQPNDADAADTDIDAILRQIEAEQAREDAAAAERDQHFFQALASAFEPLGWTYTVEEEHQLVRLELAAEHLTYAVVFGAVPRFQLIASRVSGGFRVPEEERITICEALNRANYGLRIGAFEMDMRDGEVVFRIGMHCHAAPPDTGLVERMIRTSIDTFERYAPAFMRIIYAQASPAEAIEEVER